MATTPAIQTKSEHGVCGGYACARDKTEQSYGLTGILAVYYCILVYCFILATGVDGDMQTRVLALAEHHSYEREV